MHTRGETEMSIPHSQWTRRGFIQAACSILAASRAWGQEVPTVHDHLVDLARDAPLKLLFKGESLEDIQRFQVRFAKILRSLLGPFQPPREWRTIRERTVEHLDHIREELILQADQHPSLPVHYLKPASSLSRTAGVVALHGHGPYGYDPVSGKDSDPGVAQAIRTANYDYGRQLARRGYAVVIPCFTPFGRRTDPKDSCAVTFVRMQLLGRVLMAQNLRDALWAFEFLRRQSVVDPERIGCVGFSYGGRMTMLAAALEKRFRVAVISGALNLMQERIQLRYSCGAQVIPGLLEYGDVPEIASLLAPRPCLWEVGSEDGLIDPEWAKAGLERIGKAYSAYGADGNLMVDRFQGGHRWNGIKAYPLLDRILLRN